MLEFLKHVPPASIWYGACTKRHSDSNNKNTKFLNLLWLLHAVLQGYSLSRAHLLDNSSQVTLLHQLQREFHRYHKPIKKSYTAHNRD